MYSVLKLMTYKKHVDMNILLGKDVKFHATSQKPRRQELPRCHKTPLPDSTTTKREFPHERRNFSHHRHFKLEKGNNKLKTMTIQRELHSIKENTIRNEGPVTVLIETEIEVNNDKTRSIGEREREEELVSWKEMAVVESNVTHTREPHDYLKEDMKNIQESLTRALEGLQKITIRTKPTRKIFAIGKSSQHTNKPAHISLLQNKVCCSHSRLQNHSLCWTNFDVDASTQTQSPRKSYRLQSCRRRRRNHNHFPSCHISSSQTCNKLHKI